LLEELKNQVSEAIDEEIKCLRAASTPQAKDRCDRRAEKNVCDALNRIKDRNNNELPTDELKNQWEAYGCVR
jgi:hypothetical protein